jgi:hypothetical protein
VGEEDILPVEAVPMIRVIFKQSSRSPHVSDAETTVTDQGSAAVTQVVTLEQSTAVVVLLELI